MAAPTLEFIEGGQAALELGDGERVVGQLKFGRDALGGTWVEPTGGAEATHNARPLLGRTRLVDGDELATGGTRLRYRVPVDDWTTLGEASESTRQESTVTAPPRALPSLAEDFDDPQTQQMSPEEVQHLTAAALRSSAAATAPSPSPSNDGPAPLPPPPIYADPPTTPALVLPPPVSPTAKSRLQSAFALSMADPDFGPRIPPPPPPRAPPPPRDVDPLPDPSPAVDAETTTSVIGEVHELSEVSAVEVTTASSAVTLPRDASPPSLAAGDTDPERAAIRGYDPLPPTAPSARIDPTTQPSLAAIQVPEQRNAMERASRFLRALWSSRSLRGVLLVDVAWAVPLSTGLGWATAHTGAAWPLALAGGVLLLGIATARTGARVAPRVSGLTLASARVQVSVGVGRGLVAVARLRALVAAPIAVAAAIALVLLGPRTPVGASVFLALIATALAFDAWLRAAYTACFAAWARACERAQSFDVKLAPTPLAKAFAAVD